MEPEDLVAQAAVRVTVAARELWRRQAPRAASLQLASVKLRLELFVTALTGSCPIILTADPLPAPTALRALSYLGLGRKLPRAPSAAVDGVHMFLPRSIEPSRGDAGDLAWLRLLALEMGTRAARGSVAWIPRDALGRDLYALAEASAIDAALARELPGIAPALAAERARALASRPDLARLSACERAVEQLACRVLASDLQAPEIVADTPSASRAWNHAASLPRHCPPRR